MTGRIARGPRIGAVLRSLLALVVLTGAVVLLHLAIDRLLAWAEKTAMGDMLTLGLIALLLMSYALLIAVPFVPGIEIGLSLLALRGAEVAPFVYLATLCGLMLAFLAGSSLPLGWLEARLRALRLNRTAELVAEVAPLSRRRRLVLLRRGLPRRLGRAAVRSRYLALALLVNLPGSGLIGGGGGICLMAGLTGLYGRRATLVTLAVAVAPVPLLVWAFGWSPGMPPHVP